MLKIEDADFSDLEQILQLQYLAYQSEAILNNNFSIPPLMQKLEDLQKEYQNGIILKAIDEEDDIIGSVRGYTIENTLFIGKLIVHPEHQRKGIGTRLLQSIEDRYPKHRYELFTSNKSDRNIKLYEHLGYKRYKEQNISPELTLIYLEKITAL